MLDSDQIDIAATCCILTSAIATCITSERKYYKTTIRIFKIKYSLSRILYFFFLKFSEHNTIQFIFYSIYVRLKTTRCTCQCLLIVIYKHLQYLLPLSSLSSISGYMGYSSGINFLLALL